MGRRWWQKEARAKAEQEKRAQKNASSSQEDQEATDTVEAAVDETVEFESDVAANEATIELIQTIADIGVDDAVAHEPETEPEAVIEDVAVPGITVTRNNFNASNNKKKRRR